MDRNFALGLAVLAGHGAVLLMIAQYVLTSPDLSPARLTGAFLFSGAAGSAAIVGYLGLAGVENPIRWLPSFQTVSALALAVLLVLWGFTLFLFSVGAPIW